MGELRSCLREHEQTRVRENMDELVFMINTNELMFTRTWEYDHTYSPISLIPFFTD